MRAHSLVSQTGDAHVAGTWLAVRRCDERLHRRFIPSEADDVRRLEIFQYKVKGQHRVKTDVQFHLYCGAYLPTDPCSRQDNYLSIDTCSSQRKAADTHRHYGQREVPFSTDTHRRLTPARRSINPVRSMIVYDLEMPAAYTDYNFVSKASLLDLNLKTRAVSFSHLHNKDRFVAIEKLLAWQQM
jgi:hypothetical protein